MKITSPLYIAHYYYRLTDRHTKFHLFYLTTVGVCLLCLTQPTAYTRGGVTAERDGVQFSDEINTLYFYNYTVSSQVHVVTLTDAHYSTDRWPKDTDARSAAPTEQTFSLHLGCPQTPHVTDPAERYIYVRFNTQLPQTDAVQNQLTVIYILSVLQ
jgi:hypothetical protein